MKSKQEKRKEADVRNSEYQKLTPEQKLRKLDAKFGKGNGAVKQRAELEYELAAYSY